MDGREVYLCWRLGEPEVLHWHELNAGVAGRKTLARLPAPVRATGTAKAAALTDQPATSIRRLTLI